MRWRPVQWHAPVWVELYFDPPRLIILHRCSGSSFPRVYCGSASRCTESLLLACTEFFAWRVKADHPLRVRARNAFYGGACKMLSRGISLQMLTFFLQTLHPFNCRSADTLFRKSKRPVLFHKVLNRLSYFYDTLWYLAFCLVHTTLFIYTNSLFFLCKLQSGRILWMRYMQYILTWIFGMDWRMADSRNL